MKKIVFILLLASYAASLGAQTPDSLDRDRSKYATYSFSNERYYDYDVDVVFSDKRDNRLEYGFTWGAGVSSTIKDRLELGAEVRWYYSVTDIQKPYMTNLNPRYNTTFVIQGGIAFWL
jgi:opacity protein-like surface antigen